jgi:hypothetical protein
VTAAELAPLLRRHAASRSWGLVYAIQVGDDGPVKIGRSDNPAQRLRTLQTASAEPLRGLAAWPECFASEDLMHEEFAHVRIRGEWFRPVPELLEMVLDLGGYFCDWGPS